MLEPYFDEQMIEAGVDEAGRGSYVGPVFASAVILKKSFKHPLLNDSKKLKKKDREYLRKIIEAESISYAVAFVNNEEIDKINILQASFKAMHLAIDKLKQSPDLLLIDGNKFLKYKNIQHHCIVKGDGKYNCIAAASILAKTYRDEYMQGLHSEFEYYYWNKNMGYGTLQHRQSIDKYGLCRYHRKSYKI